jgi:hypothetical protein
MTTLTLAMSRAFAQELELGEAGVVRVGAVHDDTAQEVARLVEALERMAP